MATEDGKRMTEECQKMMSKITQSLGTGKVGGST
jgi:hypothetical protein